MCIRDRYDALISALDALGDDEDDLSFDHVKARIMQEEQRIGMRQEAASVKAEAAALLSNRTDTQRERPSCKHCKKIGHYENKCWKKYPHLNPHKNNDNDQTAFVTSERKDNDPEVVCLLAKHKKSIKLNHWFIDSGCSNHLTHDKSLFISYSDLPSGCNTSVEVGNGDNAVVIGKGTINLIIQVENISKTCQLSNVLYAPDLDYNLVSVSSLDKKGLTTVFANSKCIIQQKGKVLATGSIFNNLYKLDIDFNHIPQHSAFVTKSLHLWHQRLAHVDHNLSLIHI